jgi:hypothetical protein
MMDAVIQSKRALPSCAGKGVKVERGGGERKRRGRGSH